MAYLLTFLEGIITFISPCLLPMLPIYISYFAGGEPENKSHALLNAVAFVLGFTIVFVSLGAFAGTLGTFLVQYSRIVNLVAGVIVMVFGFSFLGWIRLPFFSGVGMASAKAPAGFFSTLLFGIIFSVSWTPCIGTFLGSALMLAASSGQSMTGIVMLLSFSAGLGIPFIMSAVLIDKLKTAFDFIKKHYKVVNLVCGLLLVAVGVLLATGLLGYYLSLFSL